jgi:hypothetical protein
MILASTMGCAQKKSIDIGDINTTKNDKLTRIMGSRLFLNSPKDYQYIKNLSRFQKSDNQYLQVIEANNSFLQAKANMTKEVIEQKGAKVDVWKKVKVNAYDGIYFEGPSKKPGETKIMLSFGDNDFVVMVVGVCATSDEAGKDELKNIFKTVYFDKSFTINPLELANFEFDQSITQFKYATTASNIFFYNKSGSANVNNNFEPAIQVGALPQMKPENAQALFNDILRRIELSGIKVESKKIESSTINNYPSLKLETPMTIQGKNGFLYQVILMGQSSSVLFMSSTTEDIQKYKDEFIRTSKTIRIK